MCTQNTLLVTFLILLLSSDTFSVKWHCRKNLDCESLDINATCSNGGSCVCPPGHVYSTTTIECLPAVLFGEKCNENVQCSLMPTGAACIENVCQCKQGYTYIHGRCNKLSMLGEKCSKDIDCWFGYNRQSVVCSNTLCKCATGYYKRHSEICRQRSKESEPCVVHTDCDTRNCVNFQCKTNKSNSQIPFSNLSTTKYDFKILPLKSINTAENELTIDNFESQVLIKKFGDDCTNIAEQCEGLDNSICIENVCYCHEGYYPHPITKICIAELGERANSATCNHKIISGFCSCEKNFFSDDNLRTCRKSIVITAPCTADNQCSPYAAYCKHDKPRICICPKYSHYDAEQQLCIKKEGLGAPCGGNENCPTNNSICSEDKICICKDKYLEVDGLCLAGIGANCIDNQDCKIENAICSMEKTYDSKTCICQFDFVHHSDKCLKKALHLGDDCIESKQCESMNANCVQNSCLCAENHHYSHGKCELRKYIGESCSRVGECFLPVNQKSVECRNSICACKDIYHTDFKTMTCVKSKDNSSPKLLCMVNLFSFVLITYSITVIRASLIQVFF